MSKVAPWAAPRYPGDAVRRERLVRDQEIGEIVLRVFGPGNYEIAGFLPGRYVQNEGDSPKTEPEWAWGAQTKAGADSIFDGAVVSALGFGWKIADPPR